jgi:N-acetylglucosamine malate deacetylase 1
MENEITKKALIVSAHPDDETIGCAGTMLQLGSNGWKLYWLIFTDVYAGSIWSEQYIASRKKEIPMISEFFGFKETHHLGYPTTTLDEIPMGKMVSESAQIISSIRPDWVFFPNRSDVHTDHRITADVIFSACKSFRTPYINRLLMYECLSETEFGFPTQDKAFVPNFFVDVSRYLGQKKEAMKIYRSEVMEPPFPRSKENLEALARYRGSRIGVDYAEAFMSIYEKYNI